MDKEKIMQALKGGIIASCQIEKHAPCYSEDIVKLMIQSVLWGGACGLRLNGIENIRMGRSLTDKPIIGLIKVFREDTEVFMTPTMNEVDAVLNAGADIVAIDGTDRMIGGHPAYDLIPLIRAKYPNCLIFADVRDNKDALKAVELGVDFVAPTFYRFKSDAKSTDVPDWKMFVKICKSVEGKGKAIMEGKIWTPDDAIRAFHYGAYSVVIGSAITRPHIIMQRFHDHVVGFEDERSLFY